MEKYFSFFLTVLSVSNNTFHHSIIYHPLKKLGLHSIITTNNYWKYYVHFFQLLNSYYCTYERYVEERCSGRRKSRIIRQAVLGNGIGLFVYPCFQFPPLYALLILFLTRSVSIVKELLWSQLRPRLERV